MIGKILGRCLRALGFQRPVDLISYVQPNHPSRDTLQPGTLIVVRDGNIDKWICFLCPCGCGEKIQLSMNKARRPQWSAETDWFRRSTLKPSVRQTAGCRSHFWVKQGRVEWCHDSPTNSTLDNNWTV